MWCKRFCIVLTMLSAACGADVPRGVEHTPGDGVERLGVVSLDGDDIGLVRDFDIAGDTIYLLDMTGRVAVIGKSGGRFELVRHFARRGSGPGELLEPTGLAVTERSIIIVDRTRLHVFDRSGDPLHSRFVKLPCLIGLPSVSAATGGTFVHGNCLKPGLVTDTMMAVLAWAGDTSTTFERILEVPRFTRDGRMGTMFGASRLLTTGRSGLHAFGGGETNCVWLIDDNGERPSGTPACPAANELYSADAPPEFRDLRTGVAGMDVRWPDPLPAFRERILMDDGRLILLRPWSGDSLVVQTAAPSAIDLAVAPMNGLLGCRTEGCLWLFDEEEDVHMIVLGRSDIARRLRAAEAQ